jgi:hypothetical protein
MGREIETQKLNKYVEHLFGRREILCNEVFQNQKKRKQQNEKTANKKRKVVHFDVGEKVLVKDLGMLRTQ